MIAYWVVFVIGILIGKFLWNKETGQKLRNKIRGKKEINKRMKSKSDPTDISDITSTHICPMCNGDEFVYDNELKKQVKCPNCKGTGKIEI